ncbi:MAG: exodeoxyribonuclease VII small subunit [Gammaproteobacteria bacterium]
MTRKKTKETDFETALAELETLVAKMEEGDLPLEDALRQFERGVTLTQQCQQALRQAEQKVEILMEKAGGLEAEPFDPDQ